MLLGGRLVAERASTVSVAASAPAVFIAVAVSVERRGGVGTEGSFSLGLGTGGSSIGLGSSGTVGDGVSGGLAVDTFLGLGGPSVGGGVSTETTFTTDDESTTSVVVDLVVALVVDLLVGDGATNNSGATVLNVLLLARLVVGCDTSLRGGNSLLVGNLPFRGGNLFLVLDDLLLGLGLVDRLLDYEDGG